MAPVTCGINFTENGVTVTGFLAVGTLLCCLLKQNESVIRTRGLLTLFGLPVLAKDTILPIAVTHNVQTGKQRQVKVYVRPRMASPYLKNI